MHTNQRAVRRWEEDTEGVHADLRQKSLDWLSECFEAAHQSARQAIDYMCNFIGMKASYHPWMSSGDTKFPMNAAAVVCNAWHTNLSCCLKNLLHQVL